MENKPEKSLYLPGLNGIRAIASIAVVISHTTLALPADFHLTGNIFGTGNNGQAQGYLLASYGVTMFFVLSGFLITYLLQLESDRQEIDIRKFYLRRILRIWPLYYLYLALCIVTMLLAGLSVSFKTTLFYIFFAANIPAIFNFSLPFLSHFWSIGVEEQFYLFWPWMVKKIKRNLVPVVIALIVLQNLLRAWLWLRYPGSNAANFSVITRFDCMMMGAVGAILFKRGHALFLRVVDNKISQAVALGILGLLIINKFHINALVDNFVIGLVTLAIIVGQINKRNRLISFDNKVFDFLGKISFGVYVYHPLLIFLLSKVIAVAGLPIYGIGKYIMVYVSVLSTTIIVAHLSYNYFESWFIRLKSRFAIVKSSGFRTQK